MKKIKISRLSYIILIAAVIISLTTNFFSIYQQEYGKQFNTNSYKIKYENLTASEIAFVNKTLEDLDPEYLAGQGEITFTNHIMSYCLVNHPCSGVNYVGQHKIYIQFFEDDYYLKYLICHELLHTYMDGKYEEDMVERIASDLPCFKDKIGIRIKWSR